MQDIYDIKIQYFAKVDFSVFVDVVDALGGVEVSLYRKHELTNSTPAPDGSSRIYDPLYGKSRHRLSMGQQL